MIIPTGNQWEIVHRIILLPLLFDQFLARKLKKKTFFFNFCNETFILHDCTVVEDKKVFG